MLDYDADASLVSSSESHFVCRGQENDCHTVKHRLLPQFPFVGKTLSFLFEEGFLWTHYLMQRVFF